MSVDDRNTRGHGFDLNHTKRFGSGYRGRNQHHGGLMIWNRIRLDQAETPYPQFSILNRNFRLLPCGGHSNQEKFRINMAHGLQKVFEPLVIDQSAHDEDQTLTIFFVNTANRTHT